MTHGDEILPEPFKWLASKAQVIPLLALLVRRILAIHASHALSKRLSSSSSLIVNKRRNSLGADNVGLQLSYLTPWAGILDTFKKSREAAHAHLCSTILS